MAKFIDDKINQCDLTTCRYNVDKKCVNQNKRKECIEVSKKVLCLEKKYNKNPFNICETNPNCENAGHCKYAIECTTFEDLGKGIKRYINGCEECPMKITELKKDKYVNPWIARYMQEPIERNR